MPRIIDYPIVLERLEAQGLRCLYYNGGAFGFAPGADVKAIGWIGADDPSLRAEAREWTRRVAPTEISALFDRARHDLLPGEVWIMPKSHWAFELDHSPNAGWLANAVEPLNLDPGSLRARTDAAAIAFDRGEPAAAFIERLLTQLRGSDFAGVFPGHNTVCTIHHHRQLWWQTTDVRVAEGLDRLVQSTQSSSSSSATG